LEAGFRQEMLKASMAAPSVSTMFRDLNYRHAYGRVCHRVVLSLSLDCHAQQIRL
jgi:hypothetical protein